MEFNNKLALITGGSSGIGKAIAMKLLAERAKVIVLGRDQHKISEMLNEINDDNLVGIAIDCTSNEAAEKVFRYIKVKYGSLDILINNAGLPARSVIDHSAQELKYILETNILGYLNYTAKAVKMMKKNGGGHIINIGSMSAKVREAQADLYVTSKTAIEGFSQSLRKKINRYNIKTSLIEPGNVSTGMVTETMDEQEKLISEQKMLTAEDVAEAVCFCLSRSSQCEIVCLEIRPHKQSI